MEIAMGLALELLVGGSAMWLVMRSHIQTAYSTATSEVVTERATTSEQLRHKDQQLQDLRDSLKEKEEQIQKIREGNADLRAKISELDVKLNEERRTAQDKLDLLNQAQQKLADAFKAL